MKHAFLSLLCLLSAVGVARAQDLLPDLAVADYGQHVVINIPQLRLFLFENGEVRHVYPIAVGKNRTQTPLGEYTIRNKAYKPTWSIPLSIQKERAQQGLPAITSIPPGPDNPLGPVFVRFGDPSLGLGIHGTNAPSSVPGWRSHGCVRMKSESALKFADIVDSDSPVSVIYQRYALNQDDDGQLWLAVYTNPYKQKDDSLSHLTLALENWAQNNGAHIDMTRLQSLLKKPGKPFCLTCTEKNRK
ncbi:MAG: L,D-transpeptidase [Neisseria sp.]|nr:L,D-transpeptidase [Neisseria sp.]